MYSFKLFGEFDHVEDWDAAAQKETKEYQKKEKSHRVVNTGGIQTLFLWKQTFVSSSGLKQPLKGEL